MQHNTLTIKSLTFSSLQSGIAERKDGVDCDDDDDDSADGGKMDPSLQPGDNALMDDGKKDAENNDVEKGDGGDGVGRCGGVDWSDFDGDDESNDNEESCGDDERGKGVDECPDGNVLLVDDGVDGDSGGRGCGGGAPVAARIKEIDSMICQ